MHKYHPHHSRSPHARSVNDFASTASSLLPRAVNSVFATFNHAEFVYHLNLFIVCIVVIFILCAIPRFFFRFSHRDEWRNGHMLRSKPAAPGMNITFPQSSEKQSSSASSEADEDEKKMMALSPMAPAYFSPTGLPEKRAHMLDPESDAHLTTSINLYDSTDDRVLGKSDPLSRSGTMGSTMSTRNLLSRNASTLTTASTRVRRRREGLPAHMPSFSARIPYMTNILRFTLRPGMDVGKAMILVSYFGILLYGTFYKSNVFSNAIRTGYLAVSQIPVVVVLGTKNNPIGMLLGMGYERVCVSFLD